MGLIGGGGSGFIGRVHAIAATMDRRAELVAGAFSSHPARSRAAAGEFGVASRRAYASYRELFDEELNLPPDERIDFVSIATPNATHFEIAQAALTAGFHVVCDKPMTVELSQAQELAQRVAATRLIFALTHSYSGYPAVRQAREMILGGDLGTIQALRISYLQSGLRGWTPEAPPARGAWKADPRQAGPSGTMGDLGSHAFHLARYLTNLAPLEVACQLKTFLPGRLLDDYGHALIRFANDALGAITVSQVTHGRLNDLSVDIDGESGSLAWRQEHANQLAVRCYGKPLRIYERNPRADYSSEPVRAASRLPGGHPEGFLEAFANLYRAVFDDMAARAAGGGAGDAPGGYPTVDDGVEGVRFIQQCVASSRDNGDWKTLSPRLGESS